MNNKKLKKARAKRCEDCQTAFRLSTVDKGTKLFFFFFLSLRFHSSLAWNNWWTGEYFFSNLNNSFRNKWLLLLRVFAELGVVFVTNCRRWWWHCQRINAPKEEKKKKEHKWMVNHVFVLFKLIVIHCGIIENPFTVRPNNRSVSSQENSFRQLFFFCFVCVRQLKRKVHLSIFNWISIYSLKLRDESKRTKLHSRSCLMSFKRAIIYRKQIVDKCPSRQWTSSTVNLNAILFRSKSTTRLNQRKLLLISIIWNDNWDEAEIK